MSQPIRDINSSPTQEDPEVPACSREELAKECVKNIPKPDPNLDWAVEMNSHDKRNACQEEQQEQDVGLNYDPCLPSPSPEPIPQDLGCSGQRFEQESNQSEPIDQRKESVWEMEQRVCHLDIANAISGQGSSSQDTSHWCLGVCGQHMLRDWFTPKRNSVWPLAKVNSSLSTSR